MYQSPLLEAHLRVLERLAAHRRDHAQRASEVRGDDVDRSAALSETELETAPWGVVDDGGSPACQIILDYGELEAEYASLRRGVAIFDRSDRVVLELRGEDAGDLLDRLVSNKMIEGSAVVQAFILERIGRILADVRIIRLDDRMLLECDRTDGNRVVSVLEGFVFAEDVKITDLAATHHRIDCLGPDAPATLEHAIGTGIPGSGAIDGSIDGNEVVAFALEAGGGSEVGESGIGILVARDRAEAVWEHLVTNPAPGRRPVRPVGWNAFNIARIESGRPLFHLDFGPDAIPHETGMVTQRVDFKKGCYPGQEVVARMESRAGGRGKRRVVGVRPESQELPVSGGQVFDAEKGLAEQVGVVTSSTVSPLRGAAPIALATVRASHVKAGTRVLVNAEGETVAAVITEFDFEPPGDSDS
ncbi:MAG: hypothetical protein CMJ23_10295 [Phycisphaerae bacterium]|nr:hypothetical protein [Phycisphaerae bacterium]